MFNIKTFNIDELKKENNYIINKYFNNLKEISVIAQVENNYAKYDIILNNIPYTMYKSNKTDFNLLLIPKNLRTFENNFDNIIIYSGNEFGLHLSILNKSNNLLESINYNFITNDFGYVNIQTLQSTIQNYLERRTIK